MSWAMAQAARLELHQFLRLQHRVSRCCELAVEHRRRSNAAEPSEECCRDTIDLFERREELAQGLQKIRAAELPPCCQGALSHHQWWEGLQKAGGVSLSESSRMSLVTILYQTSWRPITPKDVEQWSRAISELRSAGRQDLIEAAEECRRMAEPHQSPTGLAKQLPWVDTEGRAVSDLNEFIQVAAAIYKRSGGKVSRLARNGLDTDEIKPRSFAAFLARLMPLLPPHMKRLRPANFVRHAREVLEGRYTWSWDNESQSIKLTRRTAVKRRKPRKKVLCPRS
jgi:hypothetical protein